MTLLARHRFARGFTQTALAKKLHVSLSAVSYWESGAKLPGPKRIKKLARLLGLSAMELTRIIERENETTTSAK